MNRVKKLFSVPDFAPHALLLWLAKFNSIEAEINMRKLVTEPKMAPSLRNLLRSWTDSLFDKDVKSIGILPNICEASNEYDLFNYSLLIFYRFVVKCIPSPIKEKSVDEKCFGVLDTLKITMKDARLLETNTKKQVSCKEWFSARES